MGRVVDPETGLIYLRARVYDPATGVFLSVDPAIDTTGQPYSYGLDNPVNRADPSGLDTRGACVSESVSAGGVQVEETICYVTDGHGGTAITITYGYGMGVPGAGAALSYQWSDAPSVHDLQGGGYYSGAGAGAGFSVSGEVTTSTDGKVSTVQVGIGLAAGPVPFDVHAGYSYTTVLNGGYSDWLGLMLHGPPPPPPPPPPPRVPVTCVY